MFRLGDQQEPPYIKSLHRFTRIHGPIYRWQPHSHFHLSTYRSLRFITVPMPHCIIKARTIVETRSVTLTLSKIISTWKCSFTQNGAKHTCMNKIIGFHGVKLFLQLPIIFRLSILSDTKTSQNFLKVPRPREGSRGRMKQAVCSKLKVSEEAVHASRHSCHFRLTCSNTRGVLKARPCL